LKKAKAELTTALSNLDEKEYLIKLQEDEIRKLRKLNEANKKSIDELSENKKNLSAKLDEANAEVMRQKNIKWHQKLFGEK
jgi:hypothetical protein